MKNKTDKKSLLFLAGSFLLFISIFILLSPWLVELREEVFADMKLQIFEKRQKEEPKQETATDKSLAELENLPPTTTPQEAPTYNYDYIGYLEIPKIGFKRGFVAKDSPYNNIEYNITLSSVSDFPDKEKGNVIIMGHSGYGYAAFFATLHKITNGDLAIVTYNNKKYTYKLVNSYLQDKTGEVAIFRDFNKKALTLITCTYQDNYHQTIFVFEPV